MTAPPASQFQNLLELMYAIGMAWTEGETLSRQVWGHHLLEDWKSLSLLADKVAEED